MKPGALSASGFIILTEIKNDCESFYPLYVPGIGTGTNMLLRIEFAVLFIISLIAIVQALAHNQSFR